MVSVVVPGTTAWASPDVPAKKSYREWLSEGLETLEACQAEARAAREDDGLMIEWQQEKLQERDEEIERLRGLLG